MRGDILSVRFFRFASRTRLRPAGGELRVRKRRDAWGFVEGRIQGLQQVRRVARSIRPEEIPVDRVGIGSRVKARGQAGDVCDLVIVTPLEADPDRDRVSHECPLGAALFGKQIGDVVTVHAPEGTSIYRILAICR